MENKYRVPKQMVEGFLTDGTKKAQNSIRNIMLLGFMAGMFIAVGACCSSAAVFGIENAGLAKVVAGVIFPIGLMLIVLIGGELFTGDCLMFMGVLAGKYRIRSMFRVLALVFVSNMMGAVLVAGLVFLSGQYDLGGAALGAYTIKVAVGKASLSFSKAITSGILCNVIVCLAVLMAYCATDVVGKLFAVFFPIMAFVIGGFEHCVANMYYIPAGVFAASNDTYRQQAMGLYGLTASQIDSINLQNFFLTNLVPVTLGNMIGGMLLIGVPLFLLHVKKSDKAESNHPFNKIASVDRVEKKKAE